MGTVEEDEEDEVAEMVVLFRLEDGVKTSGVVVAVV